MVIFMAEKKRHEYILELNKSPLRVKPPKIPGARVRADLAANPSALAQLMLSTYQGTIDYDGESLADAGAEIDQYLNNSELRPLWICSWLFHIKGLLVSACLVSWWTSRRCPIIGYVITHPDWKSRGIAAELLQETLQSLSEHNYKQVRAVITEGNIPSERLFARAGFTRAYPESVLPDVGVLKPDDTVVPLREARQIEFSEA
jgi:RimJ/RimL family protein N-acetyltransferase